MAEEIQEAVQIIRTAYDGIDIAMKIGSGALEQAKKTLDFLLAVLEHEKTMGKTDMKKLLVKGGDLQVFQFGAGDMGKVRRMAKKYGILYSVVPDINRKGGTREIIFHTEAVPRVNMMVQRIKSGRIMTVDDHLKSTEGKEAGPRQAAAAVPDQDRLDITIAENLVAEENEQAVRTRIPGTWGENARYLWIDRKNITDIHSGRTILTFLERDKKYQLYDSDNRAVSVMRGNDLYESHYDRVAAEVQKRCAEAGHKAAAGKKARVPEKKSSGRKRR